jgi:hypothetical protein
LDAASLPSRIAPAQPRPVAVALVGRRARLPIYIRGNCLVVAALGELGDTVLPADDEPTLLKLTSADAIRLARTLRKARATLVAFQRRQRLDGGAR